MTIRVGQNAQGHRSRSMRRARLPVPPPPVRTEKHVGIVRSPRASTAAGLPVSEPQAEVLRLLTNELQSARVIAQQLGRSASGVNASLYALQARGLVQKAAYKGWKLTDD
jgi:biotin operon repressor